EESANRILGAADADDHFSFGNARRHCDGVVVLWIGDARFPYGFSSLGIETHESPVNDRSDDLALVDRDAAVHDAAADLRTHCNLVDFGIPPPAFLAGPCIDRIDDAPIRDRIDASVPVERRRFLVAAAVSEFKSPSQTKTADIARVNLFQRTVPCLTGRESVRQPFFAGPAGGFQREIVDSAGLSDHYPGRQNQ